MKSSFPFQRKRARVFDREWKRGFYKRYRGRLRGNYREATKWGRDWRSGAGANTGGVGFGGEHAGHVAGNSEVAKGPARDAALAVGILIALSPACIIYSLSAKYLKTKGTPLFSAESEACCGAILLLRRKYMTSN